MNKSIKKYAILALILFLTSQGLNLVTPKIMQFVIDEAVEKEDMTKAIIGILAFVLIPCLYVLIQSIFNYVSVIFSRNKGNEYSIQLMRHLMKQDLSFFDKQNSVELLSNSGREFSKYLNFKINEMPQFYATCILSFIIIIVLFLYHPLVALLQLFFIPLSYLPIIKFQNSIQNKVATVMECNALMNQSKADTFASIMFIKSNQLEEKRIEDVSEINKKIVSVWGNIALLDSLSGIWINGFITSVFTGLTFGWIAYLVVSKINMFSYGEIFSMMNYSSLFYLNMYTVLMTKLQKNKMEGEFEKAFSYFDIISELESKGNNQVELKDKIEFRDVTFSYDEKNVLEKLSFELKMNHWNAIEGKSGIGKSTILKLIEKYYFPNEGTISIDNMDIQEIKTDWLRTQITYIAQKPSLFPGSILDNMRMISDKATLKEIETLLDSVGLLNDIKALPDGIHTDIKETGKILSGGQQQRLSIAQGLLRNTKIYLLDEITSNIDKENAEKVKRIFIDKVKNGATVISVSHNSDFHSEATHFVRL